MLKYLLASGIALSALFFVSEIGVDALGNMLKTKRETGIPIKVQLMHAKKKSKPIRSENL